MPRDSQGNFTNQYNWVDDEANGINIESSRHQSGDDDQAQGITDSLDRKGRGGMQADFLGGNFKLTQIKDGTAASDGVNVSQMQTNPFTIGEDTGSANAYVISLTPAITAYTEGLRVRFYAGNTNTGASTLQVNSLTPAPPLQWAAKDIVANTIRAGSLVEADYDGNAFQIINVPEILPQQYGGTGETSLGAALPGSGRQIFTGSGNFNKSILPPECETIKATLVGGGGGGAGGNTTTNYRGVGGASGGVAVKWIDVSTLADTEPVNLGTGGTAGQTSPSAPTDGGTGGASTFAGMTANGGNGGTAATSNAQNGVTGGTATGGDLNFTGGSSETMSATTANSSEVSAGGDTPLGLGNGGKNVTNDGQNYGAGGACGNYTAGNNGGNGAPGLLIIEWFGK